MSYIHICITKSDALNVKGAALPLASSTVHASQVIASSGTSQQSSALSASDPYQDAKYYVWTIKNAGDTVGGTSLPVYVVFGSDPTAVNTGANMRALLLVGDTFQCHAMANGEKVAVIDADITT